GPSSSHTVGPMRAAARFAREARTDPDIGPRIADVTADLYSSLAATGAGHGTLDAVVMGLEGADPETVDPSSGRERVAEIDAGGGLRLDGRTEVSLRPSTIALHPLTILPQHPNGMIFAALDADGTELTRRAMFSVGGGFVVDEADMDRTIAEVASEEDGSAIFTTGDQLLRVCEDRGIAIWEAMLMRERQWRSDEDIRAGALRIRRAMQESIDHGIRATGTLPGGLEVPRRAASWYDSLSAEDSSHLPMNSFEWVSLAALAVNEENAAGGRGVTAPTNGAAGIIPAVLHFATTYIEGADADETAVRFLLTAAAIGSLYKEHASISGAEVGCQGEVGSASSMAAAA